MELLCTTTELTVLHRSAWVTRATFMKSSRL